MSQGPQGDSRYTGFLPRLGGAAIDGAFLHIILVPVTLPVLDFSFRSFSVVPAVGFNVIYFIFLAFLLRFKGLTPGGLVFGFRVVDGNLERIRWRNAFRRLLPYILIHAMSLVQLHLVLTAFKASGDPYAVDKIGEIIKEHATGVIQIVFTMVQGFVIFDLGSILRNDKNQSMCDLLAGSVAIPKP